MPILAAANSLPGVRVWRPHVLSTRARDVSGAGLAVGSADLIGLVTVNTCCEGCCIGSKTPAFQTGRFFCLEVKWPGQYPTRDQRAWAGVVRGLGGFYAIVHSVEEAVSAVARCRAGAPE
jgi:hypothetical protein